MTFPAILTNRFSEVAALLPLLHVTPGKTTVAVVGPVAGLMAAEALRWRDTERVYVLDPTAQANDRRVVATKTLPNASCDAMLLSPDQAPDSWAAAVRAGGIIQAMTLDPLKFAALHTHMRKLFGNASPWREHLPTPIYGVLSRIGGTAPPKRERKPPPAATRLSEKYLPCLFTFGKDELSLVFLPKAPKLETASTPS
jgi:hypothetical protein